VLHVPGHLSANGVFFLKIATTVIVDKISVVNCRRFKPSGVNCRGVILVIYRCVLTLFEVSTTIF